MGDRAVAVDQNASVDLISFLKAILTAATGVECVKRLGSFCCPLTIGNLLYPVWPYMTLRGSI